MKDTHTPCLCGRELRARCPVCLEYVRVNGGAPAVREPVDGVYCVQVEGGSYAVHEVAHCTGSHMKYGTCKGSGRRLEEKKR